MANKVVKVIKGIRCTCDENSIIIKNSSKIENVEEFCKLMKERIPFTYKRTEKSWVAQLTLYKNNEDGVAIFDNEKKINLIINAIRYKLLCRKDNKEVTK